jgi:hypothetical protein
MSYSDTSKREPNIGLRKEIQAGQDKPQQIRLLVRSLEGHLVYRGRQRIRNDSAAFQTAHHSGFFAVLS